MITIVVLERPLGWNLEERKAVLASPRSRSLVTSALTRTLGRERVCAVWLTLCYWLVCHVLATLLLQPALAESGRLPSTEEREHNLLSTPAAAAAAGAAAIASRFTRKTRDHIIKLPFSHPCSK